MSTFRLVWDVLKRYLNITSPIRGLVLLFLRPPDKHHQILNVFLLPGNIPLNKVKAQQGEAVYIRSSSSCYLINGQSYSVHCDEASTIQPEHEEFHPVDGPIFFPTFEVVLPINQEEVTLMVKDRRGRPVWKRVVNLTGPRRENLQRNLPAGDTVPAERTKMTEEDLVNLLDDLVDDEFNNFKWFLKYEKVGDTEPIKESRLSRAERRDTVDLMVQKYEFAGAVKVMKSVLKKISRNDLVMKLSNISSGAEGHIMEKLKEELLNTLEDLKENEFNKFKWFLEQDDILEGFKGIPVALLERAGRRETVDLMIQKYQDPGALQVTMKVLEMIGRKDLVQRLQHLPSGPKGPGPVEKLTSVRRLFIARVSEPVLHKLLDKLLQLRIINDDEMEFARTLNRADKARLVVDMVRRKGTEASSALIDALCEVDPCLSTELKLGPSTSNTTLNVSEDNREDQLDPDDPERLFREDFTPEVLTESTNISYRFRSPGPGVFRCTLTGLVFVMTQEAELLYRTVQWDESHLQPGGKMAAGPLFDIQSPDGAVSQLQLPHCETMDAPPPEGLLSVAHIADDEMSFLEPLEITDTHVVVNVPHLSAYGVVCDLTKRLMNSRPTIRGLVLLFLRPPDRHDRILDVFLLPDNIPVEEVKAKQGEAVYIRSSSNCYLINGQSYSVHCDEASTIQPEHEQFRPVYGPNFCSTFEVFLPINQEKVTLMVKDQEGRPVWERVVNLTGPGSAETPSVPADEKLMSVRTQFVARVSEPNLHQLLDKLLQHRVINNGEMEFARTLNKGEKARQVIDMVLGKGREASSALIAALCEVDPCLSTELNLQ